MRTRGTLATLISIALLMLAGCADRQALTLGPPAPTAATSPPPTTARPPTVSLTPTLPPLTEVPVQASAEYAGLLCTVERVRLQMELAGQGAPARRVWLILNVTIENTGREEWQAHSFGFYAADSRGYTYHDFEAPPVLNTICGATLQPGERLRGVVTIPVKPHDRLTLYWLVIRDDPEPVVGPDTYLGAIEY